MVTATINFDDDVRIEDTGDLIDIIMVLLDHYGLVATIEVDDDKNIEPDRSGESSFSPSLN